MALRFMDSVDHYATADILEKWTAIRNAYSSLTVASGGRNGTNQFNLGTADNWLRRTLDAQSTWYCGAAFYLKFLPNALNLIALLDDSLAEQVNVETLTSGALRVTRNGTVLATSEDLLAANTWYFIELGATIGNTGSYELRVNGETWLSATGVDTQNGATGTASTIQFLAQGGLTALGGLDDIYICDGTGTVNNTFLGDSRVAVLLPDGAGNYSQWTPSAGANYENVDEAAPDDDTTYNTSDTAAHKDSFTYTALPSTPSAIHGVQQIIALRKDDAGARTVRPFLRIASTDYFGDAVSVLDTYGYTIRYLWETNPATDAAWTASDIAGIEAGYELVS